MKYVLVETTGSFQLVDYGHNMQMAHADRPSVVHASVFIQGRISNGQLRVLGDVTEEGTDEKFASYWADDSAKAVADFLMVFNLAGEKPATAKPTPTRRTRP